MLDNINFKKTSELLGTFKNKINGYNKSKAKLSILDKIRKFYFGLVLNIKNNQLDKLDEQQKNIKENLENYKEQFERQMTIANNEVKLTETEKNISKEELKKTNNEKKIKSIEKSANEIQAKIDEIDNKEIEDRVADIKPIENTSDIEIDQVSKNLEAEADKVAQEEKSNVQVEQELKNVEEELKNTVNASTEPVKIEEPSVNVEQPKEENEIEKIKAELTNGFNEEIKALSIRFMQTVESKLNEQARSYETKLQNQKADYENEFDVLTNKAEKIYSENKVKIDELTSQNKKLATDKDNAYSTIASKETEIKFLNEQVASLNSTVEANKIEMDAKDKEIERLKVFEQRWMLMSQAMAPVAQAETLAESTKTR